MDDEEFNTLIPRAVEIALRMRQKLETFHSHVYKEDGVDKIGYGFNISRGITEYGAINLVKEGFQKMGHALMRRAFEINLAADSVRFGVFIELAERAGEDKVLQEDRLWRAAKTKDYWALHDAFLQSPLITAYGMGAEGRKRVSYLSRVLVEGEAAI